MNQMNQENIKFNNNLLVFLVENQKYLDTLACSKGGSDRYINTHRENNTALIEWYKKGNMVGVPVELLKEPPELSKPPQATSRKQTTKARITSKGNKRKYEIPPVLKEQLREHEVELVEYMLKVGFYSSGELWLNGVQASIKTYCQAINEKGLDYHMIEVKECISRVKDEIDKGSVKNKQGYLLASLKRITIK